MYFDLTPEGCDAAREYVKLIGHYSEEVTNMSSFELVDYANYLKEMGNAE